MSRSRQLIAFCCLLAVALASCSKDDDAAASISTPHDVKDTVMLLFGVGSESYWQQMQSGMLGQFDGKGYGLQQIFQRNDADNGTIVSALNRSISLRNRLLGVAVPPFSTQVESAAMRAIDNNVRIVLTDTYATSAELQSACHAVVGPDHEADLDSLAAIVGRDTLQGDVLYVGRRGMPLSSLRHNRLAAKYPAWHGVMLDSVGGDFSAVLQLYSGVKKVMFLDQSLLTHEVAAAVSGCSLYCFNSNAVADSLLGVGTMRCIVVVNAKAIGQKAAQLLQQDSPSQHLFYVNSSFVTE